MNKQRTLKGSFSLFGKGLHTGLNLTITFNPATENTGIKIQRIDLDGQPVIDAVAERVTDTQRGTVLCQNTVRVSTVEHALAALYALGIDNCLIQVNGPEFPILDGSAAIYVDRIMKVGIEELNAPKDFYIIRHKIEVKDEETGSCITILPDDNFSITVMCSFQSKFINSQFASLDNMDLFAEEVAPARTFVFVRDIEPLLHANLIKGGDMENAIVIYEKQIPQEQLDKLADLLKVPHMDATKMGYIQPHPAAPAEVGERVHPPQTARHRGRHGTHRQTHQGTYHRHTPRPHHQQQVRPPHEARNQEARDSGSYL